jgi:hypothetical protein
MQGVIHFELLVQYGIEALVGGKRLTGCLIVIRQRFRLVPTSEEQA